MQPYWYYQKRDSNRSYTTAQTSSRFIADELPKICKWERTPQGQLFWKAVRDLIAYVSSDGEDIDFAHDAEDRLRESASEWIRSGRRGGDALHDARIFEISIFLLRLIGSVILSIIPSLVIAGAIYLIASPTPFLPMFIAAWISGGWCVFRSVLGDRLRRFS